MDVNFEYQLRAPVDRSMVGFRRGSGVVPEPDYGRDRQPVVVPHAELLAAESAIRRSIPRWPLARLRLGQERPEQVLREQRRRGGRRRDPFYGETCHLRHRGQLQLPLKIGMLGAGDIARGVAKYALEQ